ncbi:cytochrome P450 6a2-like isoform X2 [Thrips palmi]|uniref:Cytochrome P450 6a2-like isoform X2 n=1 Tax=Thrips palmi TaxID=161013 RepID=A0A6P8ZSD5_THRPL|nr:cytochrome P450 6a2-like isoform X2 [Thrips palmi]
MQFGTTAALAAATVAVALTAVYVFYARRYSYWRKRGVPHLKPVPILGNMNLFMSGFKVLLERLEQFRDEGVCGLFMFSSPALAVWDPEMVKQVLCKDFSSFHDRGMPYDEADPLKWRNLRTRMSPTFTSGKMKRMLPLMREAADDLRDALAEGAARSEGSEVDMLLFLHRFSTDVIGSCAFGMRCNCLREENNKFLAMSRNLLRQTFGQLLRVMLNSFSPRLAALLPMRFLFPEEHQFFLTLMRDTVEFREKNKVQRHDFVDLMMQLRDAGLDHSDPDNHVELTTNMMAAQAFIFFVAGLDNVSNTLGYCLNRLSIDQALQDRVRAEVDDVLRRHGGDLSYEALKEMDLVNRTILEGLRLWNPIGVLFRRCNATTCSPSRRASTRTGTLPRRRRAATPTPSCPSGRAPASASRRASPSWSCGSPSPSSCATSPSARGPSSSGTSSWTPSTPCPLPRMGSDFA